MATKVKAPMLKPTHFTNNASPELTSSAVQKKDSALGVMALGAAKFAANGLSNVVYQLPTTDVDTFAVTMSGDGAKYLLLSPEFCDSLETQSDVIFCLSHEWMHIALRHLVRNEDRRDDNRQVMAEEIVINALLLAQLQRQDMPKRMVDVDGVMKAVATGIDPREAHKKYVAAGKKAGLADLVDYNTFTGDEHTCYSELCRLPEPPKQSNDGSCVHASNQGGAPADGQGGKPQLDQETLDDLVRQAIQQTMTEARRGNDQAKEELLKLAAATENENPEAQKMWGLYGIGGLRGQTDAAAKVSWWKQFLRQALASRLEPGSKLIIPRKRMGVTMQLEQDPMMVRRGMEPRSVVDIYLDTSGSMPQGVIDEVAKLVGEIPGAVARFYMFDGVVMKLVPGETVRGGGGTNFQNCIDVAEDRIEVEGDEDRSLGTPDAVIMLTDGYADHVEPAEASKWIWLITPGGDSWPGAAGMACHEVDFDGVTA